MIYDEFPLEDIIVLYCATLQDGGLNPERVNLHYALCRKLGVEPEKFSPLEHYYNLHPKAAETILRKAIRELQAGTYEQEDEF